MLDYFKRQKLQRKGLSCGKKRREQVESEWLETARSSPYVRGLFVMLFIAGLGVLVRYLPADAGFQFLQSSAGLATPLILGVLLVSLVHLRVTEPATWFHNSRVLLIYLVILLQTGLVELADFLLHLNLRPPSDILLFAPCALAPITLTLLSGVRLGFFAAIYGSIWSSMMVSHDHTLAYLLFSLSTGMVGVLATRHLRKRSQLMRAGLYVGLTGLVLAFALQHMTSPLALWRGQGWAQFGIQAGSVMVAGVITVTIVNGLLPLLEGIFKITTPISWIELSDLNHPLLRRLTMEAPGTYHHSLQVASLAEGAAEAIGADATQCRVCAYFHDIGKLERPEYCIENIHGDDNPHDDLSPSMSALIIISHVKDGVDLALKHKLNREIINVIQQHHGNSLVWFFYRRALDYQEEVRKQVALGNAKPTDVPELSEKEFRYPGPRPKSRESAIISLADAVESASRVLQKPTPQKIEQMVSEIVAGRLKDGQLDECDLTLGELDKVKESFQNRLRTILHRRIPYPDEKAPPERERGGKAKSDTTILPAGIREEKEVSKPPVLGSAATLLESAETARFAPRLSN